MPTNTTFPSCPKHLHQKLRYEQWRKKPATKAAIVQPARHTEYQKKTHTETHNEHSVSAPENGYVANAKAATTMMLRVHKIDRNQYQR